LGADGKLCPRVRSRRAECEQSVHRRRIAVRGGAVPQPARSSKTAVAAAGGAALDQRGRDRDLRPGYPQPSPQPRDRARQAGRPDPQRNGRAETPRRNQADLWRRQTAAEGEKGAGGSEGDAREGGRHGLKTFPAGKVLGVGCVWRRLWAGGCIDEARPVTDATFPAGKVDL